MSFSCGTPLKVGRECIKQARTPNFLQPLGVNLSVLLYVINGLTQIVTAVLLQPKPALVS